MSDSIPDGFRQIPGFPRYAVDEHGNVLSICPIGQGKNIPWKNARRLNPTKSKDGYLRVYLTHDGREQTVYVHALVLTTFVGPRPEGLQCRHLDGNPANNHVSNLAWGTPLENEQDKILHGTKQRGEKGNGAKLTEEDVLEIRRRAASGETQTSIAKDFSVDRTRICRIVLRKTWAHVHEQQLQDAQTSKFFNDRHDARVASGNQSLLSE